MLRKLYSLQNPQSVRFLSGAGHASLGRIEGVEHVIAVASGKGGVGKSTTAVNLAVALARLDLGHAPLRVGIMDADVYGPSIPRLLNIHAKPAVGKDDKMVPVQAHGVGAMSMGLLMDSQSAAIWRGPMVMSALNTFINGVHWGPLDVLVIDMPPGTGDAQISISQRLALSGAVIVTTPQELALMDARRGITMFRKVNVPILGIVENMSSFICGCCGSESFIFGKGGADAEAVRTRTNVLGHVPLHIDIRTTSDEGEPIVVSKPESLAAQEYMNIARKVWNGLKNQLSTNALPEIHVT